MNKYHLEKLDDLVDTYLMIKFYNEWEVFL